VSEDTVVFSATGSSDPGQKTPLTYAWDFGDGSVGTGVAPKHAYAAGGTYTVTLVVTNSVGVPSDPVSTTAKIGPTAPMVVDPTYMQLYPTRSVKLRIPLKDPGSNDGPWTYAISWGDGARTEGSLTSLTKALLVTHAFPALGQYDIRVSVRDKDGLEGSGDLPVVVRDAAQTRVFAGAGDIAGCAFDTDEATAKLLDNIVAAAPDATVYTVGDHGYPTSTAALYRDCYDPTWGRHKARTYAALGNHEYEGAGNANTSYDYFGDRVGPRDKGYYSFDLADWHVVVLNDNSGYVPISAGSAQDQWLQADLAANTKRCVLAIWHRPRFFSAQSPTFPDPVRKILWDRLFAAGAEVVLNGHSHFYERFAPQTPTAVRDDAAGMRQFIIGTGGTSTMSTPTVFAPNSQASFKVHGVLKLTLNGQSYTWEFVPIAGKTDTDFGTGVCH
jgi:PKD repeat protein